MRRFAKEGLSSASQTALARTTAMRRQRVRGAVLVLQVAETSFKRSRSGSAPLQACAIHIIPALPIQQAQLRFRLAPSTLFRPARQSSPGSAPLQARAIHIIPALSFPQVQSKRRRNRLPIPERHHPTLALLQLFPFHTLPTYRGESNLSGASSPADHSIPCVVLGAKSAGPK